MAQPVRYNLPNAALKNILWYIETFSNENTKLSKAEIDQQRYWFPFLNANPGLVCPPIPGSRDGVKTSASEYKHAQQMAKNLTNHLPSLKKHQVCIIMYLLKSLQEVGVRFQADSMLEMNMRVRALNLSYDAKRVFTLLVTEGTTVDAFRTLVNRVFPPLPHEAQQQLQQGPPQQGPPQEGGGGASKVENKEQDQKTEKEVAAILKLYTDENTKNKDKENNTSKKDNKENKNNNRSPPRKNVNAHPKDSIDEVLASFGPSFFDLMSLLAYTLMSDDITEGPPKGKSRFHISRYAIDQVRSLLQEAENYTVPGTDGKTVADALGWSPFGPILEMVSATKEDMHQIGADIMSTYISQIETLKKRIRNFRLSPVLIKLPGEMARKLGSDEMAQQLAYHTCVALDNFTEGGQNKNPLNRKYHILSFPYDGAHGAGSEITGVTIDSLNMSKETGIHSIEDYLKQGTSNGRYKIQPVKVKYQKFANQLAATANNSGLLDQLFNIQSHFQLERKARIKVMCRYTLHMMRLHCVPAKESNVKADTRLLYNDLRKDLVDSPNGVEVFDPITMESVHLTAENALCLYEQKKRTSSTSGRKKPGVVFSMLDPQFELLYAKNKKLKGDEKLEVIYEDINSFIHLETTKDGNVEHPTRRTEAPVTRVCQYLSLIAPFVGTMSDGTEEQGLERPIFGSDILRNTERSSDFIRRFESYYKLLGFPDPDMGKGFDRILVGYIYKSPQPDPKDKKKKTGTASADGYLTEEEVSVLVNQMRRSGKTGNRGNNSSSPESLVSKIVTEMSSITWPRLKTVADLICKLYKTYPKAVKENQGPDNVHKIDWDKLVLMFMCCVTLTGVVFWSLSGDVSTIARAKNAQTLIKTMQTLAANPTASKIHTFVVENQLEGSVNIMLEILKDALTVTLHELNRPGCFALNFNRISRDALFLKKYLGDIANMVKEDDYNGNNDHQNHDNALDMMSSHAQAKKPLSSHQILKIQFKKARDLINKRVAYYHDDPELQLASGGDYQESIPVCLMYLLRAWTITKQYKNFDWIFSAETVLHDILSNFRLLDEPSRRALLPGVGGKTGAELRHSNTVVMVTRICNVFNNLLADIISGSIKNSDVKARHMKGIQVILDSETNMEDYREAILKLLK